MTWDQYSMQSGQCLWSISVISGFCFLWFSVSVLLEPCSSCSNTYSQSIKSFAFHFSMQWALGAHCQGTSLCHSSSSSDTWHAVCPCVCYAVFKVSLCLCTLAHNFQTQHLYFVLVYLLFIGVSETTWQARVP